MSVMRALESTTPRSLIEMLTHGISVSMIDVRSTDYDEGGHIKGSQNIPSMLFNLEVVKDIINTSVENKVDTIVFYCKYGQVRSVDCAKTVNRVISEMDPKPQLTVSYLEGGFNSFYDQYHDSEYVISPSY